MGSHDAPLLSRGELMELDPDRLVEKIIGLRNDLADDAEEIAGLRAALETAERERDEARRERDEAESDVIDQCVPLQEEIVDLRRALATAREATTRATEREAQAIADRDTARQAHAELAAAVRAEREARMRYALAPKGTDARAEANDAAHDACSRLVALLSAAPTPTTVPAPLVRAYLAAEETMRLVAADDHRRDTYHEWAKRHGAAMDAVDAARAALVAGVARCAP